MKIADQKPQYCMGTFAVQGPEVFDHKKYLLRWNGCITPDVNRVCPHLFP